MAIEVDPQSLISDKEVLTFMATMMILCLDRVNGVLTLLIEKQDKDEAFYDAFFDYGGSIVYLTGFMARTAHYHPRLFERYGRSIAEETVAIATRIGSAWALAIQPKAERGAKAEWRAEDEDPEDYMDVSEGNKGIHTNPKSEVSADIRNVIDETVRKQPDAEFLSCYDRKIMQYF